jgi:hypothetical protein
MFAQQTHTHQVTYIEPSFFLSFCVLVDAAFCLYIDKLKKCTIQFQ